MGRGLRDSAWRGLGMDVLAKRTKGLKTVHNRTPASKPISAPTRILCCKLIQGLRFDTLGLNKIKGRFLAERFSRIFLFEPPDFFRGWCRRMFSPHVCGKELPEKPSMKIPRQNPPKFITRIPETHFCSGAGPTKFRLAGQFN